MTESYGEGPAPAAAAAETGNAANPDGRSETEAGRLLRFRRAIAQATQCFKQGDYDCALDAYQRAYKINPRPLLLFNMAQAQRKAGRTQDALGLYDRFLREEPQSELVLEVRDYINALRGSDGGAGAATQTNHEAGAHPVDTFTGTEEDRQALFQQYIATATAKFQAGDHEGAVSAYWTAYSLKPQASIVFNVAQVYRKAQRWAEAMTLFQRYLRDQPGSPLSAEVEVYIAEARDQLQVQRIDADRQTAERLAKANAVLAEQLAEIRELDLKRTAQGQLQKPKPIYRRPWFWVVIGTAAIGTALGIGLGVGLQPRPPDSELGNRMLNF